MSLTMTAKPNLRKDLVRVSRTQLRIESATRCLIATPTLQWHKSFRAARLVDDATRFVVVSVDKKIPIGRAMFIDMVKNGLEFDGKRYAWLGFTEPQLKANQFVLFREDGEWTAERLLALLGDLPAVYEKHARYGEYVARLGLSFSSTAVALKVPSHQMIEIPDKCAVDGTLTTDGVGIIRESLAKEVRASLRLPEGTSVFQTRLGGIKGVFCAYPDDVFDGLVQCTGKTIAYRPSMYKYDSNLTELEVCSVSGSSGRARLWICLVLLLISLGVSTATFRELLAEHIEDLSLFMRDRTKALEMLKWTGSAGLGADGEELYELLLSGHNLNEPYLKHMMEKYQHEQYKNLYNSLAIEVKKSARLYGVVDEEGVLEDDEVCMNLPNRTGVYVGSVVVSRNSAYATGDIRVLNAVDKPELAHLKNCIVFPTKCRRSIPDTMGGGKLDGEMYFVTWDSRLIPPEIDPPQKRTDKPVSQSTTTSGGLLYAAKELANTRRQSWTNWVKSTLGYAITPTVEESRTRLKERMQIDAAETFINFRRGGQGLLCELCTFWQVVTKSSVDYARSSLSKELVPLIEEAMDMVEAGSDLSILRQKFLRIKSKASGMKMAPDPLEGLRKMVPYNKDFKPEMEKFIFDPELDVRAIYPGRWERYYEEARGICDEFEKQLQWAIGKDKEDLLGSRRSSGYETHTESTKREWREKYFSGMTPTKRAQEFVRASAWYCYGYQTKKVTFAWLGMRYLNAMKSSATETLATGPSIRPPLASSNPTSSGFAKSVVFDASKGPLLLPSHAPATCGLGSGPKFDFAAASASSSTLVPSAGSFLSRPANANAPKPPFSMPDTPNLSPFDFSALSSTLTPLTWPSLSNKPASANAPKPPFSFGSKMPDTPDSSPFDFSALSSTLTPLTWPSLSNKPANADAPRPPFSFGSKMRDTPNSSPFDFSALSSTLTPLTGPSPSNFAQTTAFSVGSQTTGTPAATSSSTGKFSFGMTTSNPFSLAPKPTKPPSTSTTMFPIAAETASSSFVAKHSTPSTFSIGTEPAEIIATDSTAPSTSTFPLASKTANASSTSETLPVLTSKSPAATSPTTSFPSSTKHWLGH